MHYRTPAQAWVQSIGFSLAPRCCLCNNNMETALHLLFHCPFASSLWHWISPADGISYVPPLSPSKIWQDLYFQYDKLARKGASSILFTPSYVIWKCRNDVTFKNSRASQMKVRTYLAELISSSLRRIDKPFSGRPLEAICNFFTNKTLERYQRCCYNPQDPNISDRETQGWYQEVSKLKAKYESLQRSQRHLLGEDLGPLSVKELQQLERELEVSLSKARQRKTQIMMEQMEELRKKERQLGDINKQLKNKLEAEGAFRGLQGSWESGAVVGNNTFSLHPSQSGPMDCEPTLQIGYHPHFVPPEAAIPRTVAGESNFIQGWVL